MPAGVSTLAMSEGISFDPKGKAFAILRKDLDSSLPLLHVDQDDSQSPKDDLEKPEVRRSRLGESNEHLVLASLQGHRTSPLTKERSRSQGNLSKERAESKPVSFSTEDLNEALNAKLGRIQEERRNERLQGGSFIGRKPFVTTVKTGEFLMPPPEVAALLGIAPYANGDEVPRSRFKPLASLKRPEVRHQSHVSRCRAALKATADFGIKLVDAIGTRSSVETLPSDQPPSFGNIMHDRRVVRGSTFASAPILIDPDRSYADAKRKHMARKRAQSQAARSSAMRLGSPPPVPGRKHEPIQTEMFLEELFEKPIELDVSTQTDYFLDRPATPRYCPAKVGQDASTQICPGDLFDYDVEVQPILEVMVGKTIEQALVEVLEEEELSALKEQQRRFLELRAAEKAEQQRLEEQERRLRDEKNRRLRQHEEAAKTQQETEDRVAAAVLLTGYIAELLPSVLEGLKMSGFLLDEIKADVEEGFMPWLMKEVKKEMGTMVESREILMDIVQEILENRAETYKRLGEEYDASREARTPRVEAQEEGGRRDVDFLNYEPPLMEGEHV
ncbi:radial spoke head protein 3 homolog B [Orussus abietinus]|uniref:radial spoke head protein 3 homolog B n=1 Tax=Orussus abietinus TaxID=222816 RepID=UPI000625922C|nr:radial spoke head protein 3 homolog B [Orussus abietinus]